MRHRQLLVCRVDVTRVIGMPAFMFEHERKRLLEIAVHEVSSSEGLRQDLTHAGLEGHQR